MERDEQLSGEQPKASGDIGRFRVVRWVQPRARPTRRVPFLVSLLLGCLVFLASTPPAWFGMESATGILGPVADPIGSSGLLAEGPDPTDVPSGRVEPRLVRDIDPLLGEGSHPETFTDLGGILVFSADDRVVGTELWRSDGTETGTVLVKDINPGSNGSNPSKEVATAAGTMYFTASDEASGAELWKTDGTDAGTARLKDIDPGAGSSSPADLANVDSVVYFSADDGTTGRELWRTDGTEAGTMLVRDIEPGRNGSAPASLTNANGILYFVTNGGAALWKSDGTDAGTVLVRDINPGGNDSVFGLADVNGVLYFSACDRVAGCELWKTDGTVNGTVLVKDIQVGRESGGAYVKRNVGGLLYFAADDGLSGTELWVTDGSEIGTVRVKDIYPGSNGSNPHVLRDIGGRLYFTADDGVTGRELWRSDGTEAGTVLVSDIRPGAGGSGDLPGNGPWGMTLVNGIVFFSACDDVSGCELWMTDGTDAGAVQVRDLYPGGPNPGPLDHKNVNDLLFFAEDNGTTGEELWMLDPTPPILAVPPTGLIFEATGPGGAVVTYQAMAFDNFDGPIVPTCAPASGTMVPLGNLTVSCIASDSSGNVATQAFLVTVQDTTRPSLSDAQNVVAEATEPNGAVVTYQVVATDTVDPSLAMTCSQASGSLFPLGTTTVTCTARDASGNLANTTLTVTVRDTTPASLSSPEDVVAEATGPTGAPVTYGVVATDVVDTAPIVSCSPASGATFPLGTTRVTCTGRDASGNEANVSLNVTVRDTKGPALQLPRDVLQRATTSSGLVVTFEVTAQDVVDPDPVVACLPASGSSFSIGTTTVTCTATDDQGNVATGSFRVTIESPEGIDLLGVYVDPWVALLMFIVFVLAAFLVDMAWARKRRRGREEP
jgi:large repetitive protein